MNVALRLGIALLLLVPWSDLEGSTPMTPGPVRLGILLDGNSEMSRRVLDEFRREVNAFFESSAGVRLDSVYTGNWSSASIRENADRALAERTVDVVVALGPMSSQDLCLRRDLKKPAIAAFVVDAEWQRLPRKDGASGVRNLNYLHASFSARRTVEEFLKRVPFRRLGVLVTRGFLEMIPTLRAEGDERAKALGIDIVYAEVETSALDAMEKLPPGVDAIYVTPLVRLSSSAFDSLVSACIRRKLPSFSYQGRSEVEKGILASYAPSDELARRSRRIASTIHRIMGGEDAGSLPVDFSSEPVLTINMATARAIGYSPGWGVLTEAELLNEGSPAAVRTVSLASSAREAITANLSIAASSKSVQLGAQEVLKARAPLLPQITASASGTLVREEVAEASYGLQPQRQIDGTLGFSQILYADQAWAAYSIQSSLQSGRESQFRGAELDVILQATSAYLSLLRTKALSRIQRSNLKLTLSNLELARIRQTVGASNMADVYRWESQVATGRKSVLDADARVRVSEFELNRIVNRPLSEIFRTVEASMEDTTLLPGEKRLFRLIENPPFFETLSRFLVREGIRLSPELQQLTSLIEAQDRAHTAASRSFWLPTIVLQGGVRDVFAKGGAGSTPPSLPPVMQTSFPGMPDVNWQVGVQASLPIFVGFARNATLDQTAIELERLRIQYQAAEQLVSERVLVSLERAAASYAGITQASEAATAAAKNLDLVKEAYAQGAVPIVTLIDAQNASLAATEGRSDAVYTFLTDLMNVERAVGQFDFLRTPADRQEFRIRLEVFFDQAGQPLR